MRFEMFVLYIRGSGKINAISVAIKIFLFLLDFFNCLTKKMDVSWNGHTLRAKLVTDF